MRLHDKSYLIANARYLFLLHINIEAIKTCVSSHIRLKQSCVINREYKIACMITEHNPQNCELQLKQ